jgi:hypothetical protein
MRTGRLTFSLKCEQFADFKKRESELLGLPNELNPLDIIRAEQPEPAFRARRAFEKKLLFIETNGIHGQTSLRRDSADS